MSGNEVHIDGARVYLAPAGTAPPTSEADLVADGWLEFGRLEEPPARFTNRAARRAAARASRRRS